MEDEEERTRPWLSRMARKEAFWEAVVAQTLGTLMAALLIAIFASVVGVGDYAPALRFYTSAAIISILTVFAVFAVIRTFGILIERLDKRLDKRHRDNIIPGIIFLLGLPTVLGLFFILYVSVIIDRLLPALFDYYGYPP